MTAAASQPEAPLASARVPVDFPSRLHDERTAALLGLALGVGFAVCFATGVLSHLIQHPPGWFSWPPRPAGLYRITQGLHVVTGFALIPVTLAKLWVTYPRLFQRPVARSVGHGTAGWRCRWSVPRSANRADSRRRHSCRPPNDPARTVVQRARRPT